MTQVSLESVLEACEEIVTSSQQWSNCAKHPTTCSAQIWESQLQMCQKLLTLLEAATTLYRLSDDASQQPQLQTLDSMRDPPPGPVQETTQADAVVCFHSTMSLGPYELRDRESRYLGLSLVCTMMDKLAALLQQMAGQGCQAQAVGQPDARLLMLLSKTKRNKDAASAAIYPLS